MPGMQYQQPAPLLSSDCLERNSHQAAQTASLTQSWCTKHRYVLRASICDQVRRRIKTGKEEPPRFVQQLHPSNHLQRSFSMLFSAILILELPSQRGSGISNRWGTCKHHTGKR
eukprot:6462981-Amphidinium_carterae.2